MFLATPLNAIANLCYIKGYACLFIINDHIVMGDKNYLSLKREGLFYDHDRVVNTLARRRCGAWLQTDEEQKESDFGSY